MQNLFDSLTIFRWDLYDSLNRHGLMSLILQALNPGQGLANPQQVQWQCGMGELLAQLGVSKCLAASWLNECQLGQDLRFGFRARLV